MFFKIPESINFSGYVDNNNPYKYSSKIGHVLANLHGASKKKLIFWFSVNHLVSNAGKCHPVASSNLPFNMCIANTKIANVERVTLLGKNFEC